MKNPKVDILLPYWGDFQLLKEAVESVVRQTEGSWRLLIFDDHYPSLEAKKYFEKIDDKRITYHRHKKNIGITKNFNYALNSATAEYCVILGCDDRMLSNYLEQALNNIGKADFYQPGVEIIDKNGKVYSPIADRVKKLLRPKRSGILRGENLARSLCRGNWLYFPSILWRTEEAKRYRFNTKYKIVEDLDLVLNIVINGGSLSLDKTKTFQYRRFDESLSSKEKNGVRFNEEKDVYQHFANKFKKLGWNKAALEAKLHITSRIHQYLQR
jgi:glycosyltransferase involved in cell wall biosynthesis